MTSRRKITGEWISRPSKKGWKRKKSRKRVSRRRTCSEADSVAEEDEEPSGEASVKTKLLRRRMKAISRKNVLIASNGVIFPQIAPIPTGRGNERITYSGDEFWKMIGKEDKEG